MHFKKLRVHYVLKEMLRIYSIFDMHSQIIGIDVLSMSEYRLELTSALRCLRSEYGVYETDFYKDQITKDKYNDFVFGYEMTHIE